MTRANVGSIHGASIIPLPSVLTNSTPGDVLADSGQLDVGNYLVTVHGFTDVAFEWDLQLRDASNTTTIWFIRRKEAAGNIDLLPGVKVTGLVANQRLRAVCVTGPGGGNQVCLTIGVQEMG